MRAYVYVVLVGAACLLLLLPLRGGFAPPARTVSPLVVMAREGVYSQELRPGESRTYVMEMMGRSLLRIRFHGTTRELGLRIEDGEGIQVEAVDPAAGLDRKLGVVNPLGTARTLYLTVFRSGEPAAHRRVQAKGGAGPRVAPLAKDPPTAADAPGAYALEFSRDAMP